MDAALQLILLVDYILDWARDVYRPAILRLLKSMATGKSYDEVSLTAETEVFSMRRNISDWIPAPPSVLDEPDFEPEPEYQQITNLDNQVMLPIQILNTKLGSVRSVSLVKFRFVCLYITEHSLKNLFRRITDRRRRQNENVTRQARELVNFITRWDELLVINGTGIDAMEHTWTGMSRPERQYSPAGPNSEFYVVLEFGCFFDLQWDLIKEITCIAMSKPALDVLTKYAGFQKKHPYECHNPPPTSGATRRPGNVSTSSGVCSE